MSRRRIGVVARHLAAKRSDASSTRRKLLVANRGEIAVRILRAARELDLQTIAIFQGEDEIDALHVNMADEVFQCQNYLDRDEIVRLAKQANAWAIHPGYGFLSEDPLFAELAEEAGVTFVGPSVEHLRLFGDKVRARNFAQDMKVPVVPGSESVVHSRQEIKALGIEPPFLLKDPAGGGGRGIFEVHSNDDLQKVDISKGFLVEKMLENVKHIEVQIIGDGEGVVALGTRDCSVQTEMHQKLVEVAPAEVCPHALESHALYLLQGFKGAGTVEFLSQGNDLFFIEVNPRLQVEHTVSEEISSTDIVRAQLEIAAGKTLGELELPTVLQGCSVQARVCLDPTFQGEIGPISELQFPHGVGIRVENSLKVGKAPSFRFDPLLLKIISTGKSRNEAFMRLENALSEFRCSVQHNAALLQVLVNEMRNLPDSSIKTDFFPARKKEIVKNAKVIHEQRRRETLSWKAPPSVEVQPTNPSTKQLRAPIAGIITKLHGRPGDNLAKGDPVVTVTAMKMDTVVRAPFSCVLEKLMVIENEILNVHEQQVAWLMPMSEGKADNESLGKHKDSERAQELAAEIEQARKEAQEMGGNENIDAQHRKGRLTIRERIDVLSDPKSFREIGKAAFGNFVLGTCQIHGRKIVVAGEDFTIAGGSPNFAGLRKSVFTETFALQNRIPLVRLHEGGGGSVGGPRTNSGSGAKKGRGMGSNQGGDAAFARPRFESVAKVMGMVPVACVALGPVAGLPASRLVASHFSVMTKNAQILVAGPKVVERALGFTTTKEELGGPRVHLSSGVVDNLAEDEHDAISQIRSFLSFFPQNIHEVPPQESPKPPPKEAFEGELGTIVSPIHRRETYEMRRIVELVLDEGSLFEVSKFYGPSLITSFGRLDGKPVGIISNDCKFHGGAMTADAARKVRRFMETCQTFSLPIVFFVDEPGFNIGPVAEKEGTIRAGTAAVLTASTLTIPTATVVVRKTFGVAGAAHFGPEGYTILWHGTAQVGALPVESGVAIAFKRELDSIVDQNEKAKRRRELEDSAFERLSSMPRAKAFAAHEIILPAETRSHLCDWMELAWPLVMNHSRIKQENQFPLRP